MFRGILSCAVVAATSVTGVLGQSSTSVDPLNEFISLAASAASALGTAPPSTTLKTSSTSKPSSTSSATASTSAPAAAVGSGGLSGEAKSVIIAVAVIVGLLIIGLIIGCLLCCCYRRRGRRRATHGDTSAVPMRNDEWDRRNASHHGYVAPLHDDVPTETTQRQTEPLMFPATSQRHTEPLMFERDRSSRPLTSEHPALRDDYDSTSNVNSENPFVPAPPPTRKPVPGTGGHHDGALMAGAGVAGAAAGAAAIRHHEKHRDREYNVRPLPDRYSGYASTPANPNGTSTRYPTNQDGALVPGAGAAGAATGALATRPNEHLGANEYGQPAISDRHANDLASYPSNTTMVSGHDENHHHNGALLAGVGAAGAAAGAAAYHHHEKHKDHDLDRAVSDDSATAVRSHPSETEDYDKRDPNRPPTPFGLAAFGSPKPPTQRHGSFNPTVQDRHQTRSSGLDFAPVEQSPYSNYNNRGVGDVEPTVRDHEYNSNRGSFEPIVRSSNYGQPRRSMGSYDPVETPRSSYGPGRRSMDRGVPMDELAYTDPYAIPHPSHTQRNSLHEREMAGPERETLISPAFPSRSPHRASYGEVTQRSGSSDSPRLSTGAGNPRDSRGAFRGRNEPFAGAGDQNPLARPQHTLYHRPGLRHSNYTDSSSDESGLSLPMSPSWDVPSKNTAYGAGQDRRRRSGSPIRGFGRDGREQRLRFSDAREEWHYDDENAVGQAL